MVPRHDGRLTSAADAALIARVRAAGEDSDLHRWFTHTLHDLGVGHLTQLYRDAALPAEWARLGLAAPPVPVLSPSDVRRVVHATVEATIQRFLAQTVPGDGGQGDGQDGDDGRTGTLVERFTDRCLRALAADLPPIRG